MFFIGFFRSIELKISVFLHRHDMPTNFLSEKNFSWKINCIFQWKMCSAGAITPPENVYCKFCILTVIIHTTVHFRVFFRLFKICTTTLWWNHKRILIILVFYAVYNCHTLHPEEYFPLLNLFCNSC